MLQVLTSAIRGDTLAAAMIDLAIDGGKGRQTLEIADLKGRG